MGTGGDGKNLLDHWETEKTVNIRKKYRLQGVRGMTAANVPLRHRPDKAKYKWLQG